MKWQIAFPAPHPSRERAASFGKLSKERGGFPEIAVSALKRHDPIENLLQTDRVGVPHGAAAIAREAVTGTGRSCRCRRPASITFLQECVHLH